MKKQRVTSQILAGLMGSALFMVASAAPSAQTPNWQNQAFKRRSTPHSHRITRAQWQRSGQHSVMRASHPNRISSNPHWLSTAQRAMPRVGQAHQQLAARWEGPAQQTVAHAPQAHTQASWHRVVLDIHPAPTQRSPESWAHSGYHSVTSEHRVIRTSHWEGMADQAVAASAELNRQTRTTSRHHEGKDANSAYWQTIAEQQSGYHSAEQNTQVYTHRQPTPVQSAGQNSDSNSDQNGSSAEPVNLANKLGLPKKSRLQVNGFLSAGFSATNAKGSSAYVIPSHGQITNKIGFEPNSLVGLQVNANLIDNKLSAVGQFVATGDDTNGNNSYQVNAEWGYLKFTPNQNIEMRAGRFRLPAFLYSETEQVGYSYPWVFLPPEVYRIVPFDNINGVDTIYHYALGKKGWVISFQPYYGSGNSKFDLYTNAPATVLPPGTTANFDENHIAGIVVSATNSIITLRATYVHVQLSGSIPTSTGTVTLFSNEHASFVEAGAKVVYKGFIFTGEFAHRSTPDELTSLSGMYAMLGYHIKQFLPTITYGRIWTTNRGSLVPYSASPLRASELPQDQQSLTGALAYYINNNLVSKVSASLIEPQKGTSGLFTSSPGKRYVVLYGASLDAIF